jgi:non-heme chloroperoxidase
MRFVTAADGTRIFCKDWGPKTAQPIVFSHGWPLCSDAWDGQMLFMLQNGFRVVAHDRRGHGRSDQPGNGNDMDTYADDLAVVMDALDLKNAIMVGHSTGGGEVARYIGRHGSGHVAKVVLIGAVPPIMVSTAEWPGGVDLSVFDANRKGVFDNRSNFYLELAIPFFGMNRKGATRKRRTQADVLEPRHDGLDNRPVCLHSRVLGGRLHRRFEEDRQADAGHSWR